MGAARAAECVIRRVAGNVQSIGDALKILHRTAEVERERPEEAAPVEDLRPLDGRRRRRLRDRVDGTAPE